MNYYNEFDPYAAQWLRNLIEAGHIPQGEVDSRSIKDVRASDLTGFVQCHFFAGLGGWSHALRLAGWPEDRPVWTGSCPCQPFSAAGVGGGVTDERHLWPVWFNLIRECRPHVIFGEQVESAINHGWLDLVQANLEGEGYACGAAGIPAGGVGAPHIRQRLWFVADATSKRGDKRFELESNRWEGETKQNGLGGKFNQLADTNNSHQFGNRSGGGKGNKSENQRGWSNEQVDGCLSSSQLADAEHTERGAERQINTNAHGRDGLGRGGDVDQLGDSDNTRSQGRGVSSANNGGGGSSEQSSRTASATNGFWQAADWLPCRDGKSRPVEPGTFPLAHGVSARVVYTCADCKTETVNYENMRILRKFTAENERLLAAAFLFNGVLREVNNSYTDNRRQWALSSAVSICRDTVREMREQKVFGSAPQRRERDEQQLIEYRNSLPQVSCAASPSETNANVPNLRDSLCSASVEELDMFCPVCAGMGPHKCTKEMGGGRVGRLRAYGNAIVPQVAQVFIEAYLET